MRQMNLQIKCNSKNSFYLNRNDIQEIYFTDVRRYPILNEKEEHELLYKVQQGATKEEREAAKKRLVECNLRFVISIAKKLGNQENFLDLVSEGNMGLMDAIDKFDMSKNCKLITYAVSWIVAYINKYQIQNSKTVVPPNALRLHNYVRNVTKEFFLENERNPTPQEIADMVREKFDFNISNLEDVELGKIISIEEKYSVIDEDDSFEDSSEYMQRTASNNIQETIDREYKMHQLDFFLGKLNERERFIIERTYGIGCVAESFDTIGLHLDLGKERVRQICVDAVKKMQKYKEMVEK